MGTSLRVLVVEDSEDDTIVLLHTLRGNGYNLTYERVDTAAAMSAALEQQEWDIVICDYVVPGFGAPDALNLIRKKGLDLPFIIVSGTINEEIAVAAMKAGAHDFVTKERLGRLIPAIERELGDAETRRKRKHAETALQQSEERLRLALEAAYMGTWDWNILTNQITWSSGHEQLFGLAPGTFSGTYEAFEACVHPEDRESIIQTVNNARQKRHDYHQEFRVVWPDGSIHWIQGQGKFFYDAEGGAIRMIGTVLEISDRISAEQKIREQAALLDVATDAIFVQSLDHQILFWNKGAEQLYGYSAQEARGKNASELLYKQTPPQAEVALLTVAKQGKWQGELHQVTKQGKEVIAESRWTLVRDEKELPKSILTVNTDITEKKQLEAQFLRAQRLESIGTLAGGIAHDMNNLLAPILMSVQLLQMKISDERSQQLLKTLETNAKRGAAVVKQVLSFARGFDGQRQVVQVRHLISEIAEIAQETFPKSIELYNDIATDLWTVFGDATQLHQVLMNLVVNARDAMPDGGTLSISAVNVAIDQHYAGMNLAAQEGAYIVITVADTGTGMPPEIMERIFDPFFTTKELGRGTGLGLYTVFGIVKSHGGFVNVYSEMGKGTRFQVHLPGVEEPQMQQAQEIELLTGNSELILVVDDEAAIREITKASLEASEYRVLTASDGLEALALYTQHQEEISVVLMDMMMPEMDGQTAIRTLQKINPQVKIIAVSGLASNEKIAQATNFGVKAFISKPCTANELLQTINVVKQGLLNS